MQVLKEEYWTEYRLSDGRYDGPKFERLVALLLPVVYPGQWEPTKSSWDGKRDFQLFRGSQKQWAECKMYRERISINVLSPTLVMAVIEKANVILIFSYSALNTNARWYLAQFARANEKEIRVYDDEELERLILTTPEARKQFPSLPETALPPIDCVIASARLSKDPELEYQLEKLALEGDGQDVHVSIGSTFAVDVLIANAGIGAANAVGEIQIARETFKNYLLLNEKVSIEAPKIDFEVEAGASRFERLLFRPLRSGLLSPPTIVVDVAGNSEALPLDPLHVSSVLAVPLVGHDAHAARNLFRAGVSARTKNVLILLHGGSGTGKSRLLQELRDEVLARDFSVFMFTGADEPSAKADVFIRRLVSRLARLPLLGGIDPPGAGVIRHDASRGPSVLQVLYDEHFKPSENLQKCTDVVLSLLGLRKIAVIVDNMQDFDDASIDFFNRVVTSTYGVSGKTVLAFGVNDEMTTPEMPAKALAGRLESLAVDTPGDCLNVHLRGFSEADRLHYLNEALTLSKETSNEGRTFLDVHEETAKKILKARSTERPLFLEQLLFHAADRGGLELTNGVMYIADIDAFNEALTTLPRSIEVLLAKRWERIGPRLPSGAHRAVEVLAVLSSIPLMLGPALGFSDADVRYLESIGIARVTATNDARFYHEQHERYFGDLYGSPDSGRAGDLRDRLMRSGYAPLYPLELATLRYHARDLDREAVEAMARLLITTDLSGHRQRVTPILLEILGSPHDIDPSLELNAVSAVCNSIKRHRTFKDAVAVFEQSRQSRLVNIESYLPAGEAWFDFVRRHVNACFAIHRDHEGLRILQESLETLPRFRFGSDAARLHAKAHLLNRLGVAYKTIHDLEAAAKYIQESLAIARDLKNGSLTYKNHVDWGYLYHGLGAYNSQLVEQWTQALKTFDDAEARGRPLESERASSMLHRAAVQILARQDAIPTIEKGIRVSSARLNPFHEVKLLLLRVVAEIAWGVAQPHPGLLTWIDRAQDRAVTAAAHRSYWTVFYIRAKVEMAVGRSAVALETFAVALKQLSRILDDPRMELRYAPFYEDIAISFRAAHGMFDEKLATLIRNRKIRDECLRVTKSTEAEFADFLDGYKPSSTYHDGQFNLPVP